MRNGDDGKVDELGGTEDEDGFAPGGKVGCRDFVVDFRGGLALEDTVGCPCGGALDALARESGRGERTKDPDDECAPDADVERYLGEHGRHLGMQLYALEQP